MKVNLTVEFERRTEQFSLPIVGADQKEVLVDTSTGDRCPIGRLQRGMAFNYRNRAGKIIQMEIVIPEL